MALTARTLCGFGYFGSDTGSRAVMTAWCEAMGVRPDEPLTHEVLQTGERVIEALLLDDAPVESPA